MGVALAEMAERRPSVGDVRGLGVFWAVELVKDRATREPLVPYNASGADNAPMAEFAGACKDRGLWPFVHFNRTHVVPPITISDDEIQYLCNVVNHFFKKSVTPADVVWTYSGVRPLFDDGSSNASAVTRDYVFDMDAPQGQAPVLSIFGGKITTYRRLAESALAKLQPHLNSSDREWTDKAALPGGDVPRADFTAFAEGVHKRWPFLPAAMAQRLAHAYGTRVGKILGKAQAMLDLGEHYGAGLTQAEIDAAVAHQHHELDHLDSEEAAEIAGATDRAEKEGRPTISLHDKAEAEFPSPKRLDELNAPKKDDEPQS